MKNFEAARRLTKPLLLASAVGALIGPGKANAVHPKFVTPEATLQRIYKPTAIEIGRDALILAAAGNPDSSIKIDHKFKNSVIVREKTADGLYSYDLEAIMHTRKGRPYAPSTFQAYVSVTPNGQKDPEQSIFVIDGAESGIAGSWDSLYTGTLSAERGGGHIKAYGHNLHPQTNATVSNSARTMVDKAVKAGPSVVA